ncbi:MAG TPA: Gfo/Idh/MocA family oxidoreductase [Planctomycetota bacterium]|jgi:predicted dehydrogenase
MINVAVVGLGFMGVTHIKAYRKLENVRLAAICDAVRLPVDGDLSDITGNFGAPEPLKLDMAQVKATKNLDDLLADPSIDLIDLCVPTLAHVKLSVAALKAGKHVVCEKPMARTAAQCREIVQAAASAKGYFMPAMCVRFIPEYCWLKDAIDSKRYGRVLSAVFRRVGERPVWGREHFLNGEKSGGALLDMHIHDADFVQYAFGRPKAVFARGFTLVSGAIDHVLAQYVVAGDVAVSAEGGWVMSDGYGFSMSFKVIFENATVDFDSARGAEAFRLFQTGQTPQTLSISGADGYMGELQHLIDSIAAGRPPSIVTAQDGMSAVEICEAEERSIKSGQVVAL